MILNDLFIHLSEKLDKSSAVPIYLQISNLISELIEKGTLQNGFRIPGDIALAQIFGVSHLTIRKAFAELQEKKMLSRNRKIGTIVNYESASILPTIGYYYSAEAEEWRIGLADYIFRCLVNYGYDLKIIPFNKGFFETNNLYEDAKSRGLKGLIISPSEDLECLKSMQNLENNLFPYIRFTDENFGGYLRANVVKSNPVQGLIAAVDYLRNLGHKKIGFISSRTNDKHLLSAYQILMENESEFNNNWFTIIDFDGPLDMWKQFPGDELIRDYLEKSPELTAVILEHSLFCIGIIEQARLLQKQIPKDLSLVGLGWWSGLALMSPPITSVTFSWKHAAQVCVNRLINTIDIGIPTDEETILLTNELIVRESSSYIKELDNG